MICWVLAMEMLQGVWKQHLRPRAVVGNGVKIFLPSPPNYVTRSPGSKWKQESANDDIERFIVHQKYEPKQKNWNHILKFLQISRLLDKVKAPFCLKRYRKWHILSLLRSGPCYTFPFHEVRGGRTRDEATPTCAWDAKLFIAELNIYICWLLSLQRQRFQTCNPKRLNWDTNAVVKQYCNFFKQSMLQMEVKMG